MAGHPGQWVGRLDAEEALALLEQGYPAERVATRTGCDVRWLIAQRRRPAQS